MTPVQVDSLDIPSAITDLLAQTLRGTHTPHNICRETATDANTIGADAPAPISEICLPEEANCDLATLQALQFDLTLLAETLLRQLMCSAGQASDKVLAACLSDPGLLVHNETQWRTVPLLDAEAIAFSTGMNLIDQLASKDLLAGGQGWPLSAIPLWMIWGDRTHPVATQTRLLVELDECLLATLLPPSDGLDAEFPEIEQTWAPGLQAIPAESRQSEPNFQRQNKAVQELPRLWQELAAPATLSLHKDRFETLKSDAQQLADDLKNDPEQIRHLVPFWMTKLRPLIHKGLKRSESLRIVLFAPPFWLTVLQEALSHEFPQVLISAATDFQCPQQQHPAMVAAMHGFLHIDQMPCNLPWITGTDIPRILGRLVPGTPSRYRSLLVEMSDYRPPVMKLREAV